MTALTKAEFISQLKEPQVARVKRRIRLLRKTIRPFKWKVTSRHDKQMKYFNVEIRPITSHQYSTESATALSYSIQVHNLINKLFNDYTKSYNVGLDSAVEINIRYAGSKT